MNRQRSSLRTILLFKAGIGVAVIGALGAGFWLRSKGFELGDFATEMRRPAEPRYDWKSVDKKHWQAKAATTTPEATEVTDAREQTSAGCKAGMVRVKGNARMEHGGEQTGEIERLQDAACTDWISKDFPARCRTFDPQAIATEVQKLPTRAMDFCMDRFEYPNQMGQNPMIVVTFREAEAICKGHSKRLCTETEWTFACEGEEARPYPYGYGRDGTACVQDRDWRPFKEGGLQPRDGSGARDELDRLWQAEPSGSRGGCRSTFGVYDMTGNVDEWTRSVHKKGYSSVLKGGYWGPVRARCRPATRAHNEDFVAYQQSFRCCDTSDTTVEAPVAKVPSPVKPITTEATPPTTVKLVSATNVPPTRTGWDDDGDEMEALRRARVSLVRCSMGDLVPRGDVGAPMFAALALAGVWAARRRMR